MGSWCTKLSNYMGGWCLGKFNSMGSWVKKRVPSSSPRCFFWNSPKLPFSIKTFVLYILIGPFATVLYKHPVCDEKDRPSVFLPLFRLL